MVASSSWRPDGTAARKFQSPSLRGSGRFGPRPARRPKLRRVSIPFIAGQWSLRAHARQRAEESPFQSPSLRGSGRFDIVQTVDERTLIVSIPFIAGQWSLPSEAQLLKELSASFNPLHCGAVVASAVDALIRLAEAAGFNPLHCGAVVASRQRHAPGPAGPVVSIPFIAGQWSLQRSTPR